MSLYPQTARTGGRRGEVNGYAADRVAVGIRKQDGQGRRKCRFDHRRLWIAGGSSQRARREPLYCVDHIPWVIREEQVARQGIKSRAVGREISGHKLSAAAGRIAIGVKGVRPAWAAVVLVHQDRRRGRIGAT